MARANLVSNSTIDSLISALIRLKDCEASLCTGEFWTDPSLLTQTLDSTDPEAQYKQAQRCLGQLSSICQALDGLRLSSQDRLKELRDQLSGPINKAGLLSLPIELLQSILAIADDEVILRGKKTFPVTISQVCHSLREIAHNTPQLWTRLSNLLHADELAFRIGQSKGCNFDVELQAFTVEKTPVMSSNEFAQIVRNLESRWRSFSFVSKYNEKFVEHCAIDFRKLLSDLSLPQLETLRISDRMGRPVFDAEDLDSDHLSFFDFYETWEMPKLTNVEFAFNLPLHVYSFPLWRNVKTASVWIIAEQNDGSELFDFLAQCPKLTALSIRIGVPGLPTQPCFRIHFKANVAVLPNVRTLRLFSTNPRSLETVHAHVRTPAIESLSLEFQYDFSNRFSHASRYKVIQLYHSSKVKDLEIKVHNQQSSRIYLAGDIFCHYPSLNRFSIEAPDSLISTIGPFEIENSQRLLPPLRTLRLHNCTKVSPAFVSDLIGEVYKSGGKEIFKSLEIVQSTGLSKELIERSDFRDKINWHVRDEPNDDSDSDSEDECF